MIYAGSLTFESVFAKHFASGERRMAYEYYMGSCRQITERMKLCMG